MRASLFVTAVMAAAVSASPALKIVEEIHTVTKYVHAGQAHPTQAPAPKPVVSKPKPNNGGGFVQKPKPSYAPQPQPSQPSTSGNNMLDIANKWRAKYGLQQFTWDDTLVSNCEKVGTDGNGINEVHQLVPGRNMGQVITPGQQVTNAPANVDTHHISPFEMAYIAWLCEKSTDPQLQPDQNDGVDVCQVVQQTITMEYGGETGHHDILVNPSWTKIACAFAPQNGQVDASQKYQGLYVCDTSS